MGFLFFIICVVLALCSTLAFFRFGWRIVPVLVMAACIPFFITDYAGDFTVYISPAVFGITGGFCFRKKLGLDFYLTVSAIAFAVLFTGNYLFQKNVRGFDMVKASMDEMAVMLESSKSELDRVTSQYNKPKEERDRIAADIDTVIATMKDSKWMQMARDIMPFSAFLLAAAIAGTSFLFMVKFTMKNAASLVKPLQFFRLNDYFIFALISGIAGLLFLYDRYNTYPVLYVIALNTALIVSALYVIQALGIVKHYFIRRNIPVYVLPLLLITLTLISPGLMVFFMILFTGLGSLDLWADFRKLRPDTMNNKE